MATRQAPNPGEDFKRLANLMLFGFRAGPKRYRKLLVVQCIFFAACFVLWIKFNGGLLPWFLYSQDQSEKSVSPDVDILEHFPAAEKDGSRITWVCAVNTRDSLIRALESDAMMLEADVLLRGQNTDQQQLEAIMAHPPAVTSDITLVDWLDNAAGSGKGIKLDFKSTEVVELSLQKLQLVREKLRGPVYLNANVLEGPNADGAMSKVVDPQRFLRLCNSFFPHSTLSLGWTTGAPSFGGSLRYDWMSVKKMHDLVEKWELKQPLTFVVRASLVKHSLPQLKWLTEMTSGSLTVWSPSEDEVPVNDLLMMRYRFPRHKVLYDLHDSLYLEFQPIRDDADSRLSATEKVSAASTFKADKWKVVKTKGGEVIYLGNEAVLLQKGLLVTKDMHASPFVISGRVEFLPDEGSSVGGPEAGLEIYVLVTQSSRPDTLSGVKCSIGASGSIRISTHGIPGVNKQVESSVMGLTSCFIFEITNKEVSHLTLTVFRQKLCGSRESPYDIKGELKLSMKDIAQSAGHVAIKTATGTAFIAIDHFIISQVLS